MFVSFTKLYIFLFHKENLCLGEELTQQTFVGLQDASTTSPRHVLKTSSTRLQRNLFSSSKTFSRCLEDVLKTSWRRLENILQDVFKTSWKTKIVTLKAFEEDLKKCLEDALKTCIEDVYLGYLYLTNWNMYLTNLCFTNL